MQAVPYLVVEGTVVGSREVEIPAREPEEYTNAAGETKTTRPRQASTFWEVGVNCPAILDGQVDADVRTVLTVRWPQDVTVPAKGTVVRWAVRPEQLKVFMRGRWREWIAYYFCGDAPATADAARVTSRPTLAATGS